MNVYDNTNRQQAVAEMSFSTTYGWVELFREVVAHGSLQLVKSKDVRNF